jgi:tripartite-type tricarboxylate transporter receptor subunit TctC
MFAEISTTVALVKTGRLKALAVASDKPSPMLPGVPTMTDTLPGFISMSSSHLVAPPGTSKPIVDQLSGAVAAMAKDPVAVTRLAEMGAEAIGSTPAEHARFLQEERTRWAQVIERTGIKLD